jgi:serine/threonine-protein kinase
MRVNLNVIAGPNRGTRFAFSEHDTFVVGRSARAHCRLPAKDKSFSRFHFMIEVNPPFCRILDMASTNGTLVNGRTVMSADLKDGDEVRAGLTVLAVSITDESGDPDAPAGEPGPDAIGPTDASINSEGMPEHPGLTVTWQRSVTRPIARGTARDPNPVPPPSIPNYAIERQIGQGGMGVIYRAVYEPDGTPVALKTIRPAVMGSRNAIARFLREASILRRLDHANIVRFREVGQTESILYFAMELVPGTDSHRHVHRRGPMRVGPAVALIRGALEGLAYAHDRGFIHRDLKPRNLLLARVDGRLVAKIADFGLARIYQSSPMSGLSVLGEFGGSFGYLPPEQITDFRSTRPSADQYAIAATLYYLLTGKHIYDLGRTSQERIRMILEQDPVPLQARRPDLPGELGAVVHRALAREPSDRYGGVTEFREALRPFSSE